MKAIQSKLALSTLTALLPLVAFAQTNSAHIWTFANGKTFQADYLTSNGNTVYVRSQGTNYVFGLKSLSADDQNYAMSNYFILEKNSLARAGYMEFTVQRIKNFPEQVNGKSGWMDCEFWRLDRPSNDDYFDEEAMLNMAVTDSKGDDFDITANKVLSPDTENPVAVIMAKLKEHDRIRVIGTVNVKYDSELGQDVEFLVPDKIEVLPQPPESP